MPETAELSFDPAHAVKNTSAEQIAGTENPPPIDASELVKRFHREQFGKAITQKKDGVETLAGYILSLSEENNRHFVLLTSGQVFIIGPKGEGKNEAYQKTFSHNEEPLTLEDSGNSETNVSDYISASDIWKITASNSNRDDLPRLSEAMDEAIILATKKKMEKEKFSNESNISANS